MNKKLVTKLSTGALALYLGLMAMPIAQAQSDIIPESSKKVASADTQVPSDVENVKAVPGDGQITLSWDVAKDNVAVTGYKIYYGTSSVSKDGDSYTMGPVDAGNKINYTVDKLNNGTKYFFALTAYDAAGNESDNYSVEASATPAHGSADKEAPKVVKAEAVYKDTVKVTFSEAIKLPTVSPEAAFSVKNDSTQSILDVDKAVMDSSDSTQKTVLLTTGIQQAGANYIVTAGIQIKDSAGNPIVSGTTDTAMFQGTDKVASSTTTTTTQKPAADTDSVSPALTGVKVTDPTHITVSFSEPVVLSKDSTTNFIITEEKNYENSLSVKKVTLSDDGKDAILETSSQKPMNYNLIVVEVKDKAGNVISVDNNATVFFGGLGSSDKAGQDQDNKTETQIQTQVVNTQQAEVKDTKAPEDVSNFVATLFKKVILRLTWDKSIDSDHDLANYVLYKSTDGESYDNGVVLASKDKSFDYQDLVPGMKYFFKITSKDKSGNESKGVITTFTLPKTGPELALLLVGSLGLGKLMKRKNNKKK